MPQITVDTLVKLPSLHKALILGATIAILIGLYITFCYKPLIKTLNTKEEELTRLQAKLSEQKKIVADLPRFEKELREIEIKFKEALTLLPNTREIPSLLTNISNLARNCGLEIFLFQPKSEIPKSFYAEIPVEMKIAGKYHDLGIFFDRISKLPRIVNIVDLSISKKSSRGKNTYDKKELNASFKAVTFKFIESKKSSDKRGKKRKKD